MPRLLAILLVLLTIAATPPTPTPVQQLAPDAEGIWVPFEMTPGNQIRFAMLINGLPATAILDTGISVSVVSPAFAKRARMKARPTRQVRAIGGKLAAGWAKVDTVALGAFNQTGGGMLVSALPGAATRSASTIDALAGTDLIGDYALDIDFAARRFRLLRSGSMPFGGTSAPLSVAGEWRTYVTEVALDGRRIAPIQVDTGDGTAVTLAHDSFDSATSTMPVTTTIDYGLGGPIITELTMVPMLVLGGQTARDVAVRIEPPGGFARSIGMAGRVGADFLSRYRVLLDPGAGRMVLAATDATMQPPLRSTSGVLVAVDGPRLKVLHIMRGSPADRQGWRAGELICAVDGAAIPADYSGSAFSGWSVGAPGRTVSLTLCDGQERRLTLARFY